MDNLLLSPNEQRVLLRFKKMLERKYCIQIFLPENVSSCSSDLVVATVFGGKIWLVKNFLQRKMEQMKHRREQRIEVPSNVTTITLSDSDSDSSPACLGETQQKRKKKQNHCGKRMRDAEKVPDHYVDLSSTILIEDSSDEAESDVLVQNGSNDGKENMVKFNQTKCETYIPIKEKSEPPISSANFVPLNNTQINNSIIDGQVLDDTIVLSDSPPPPNFISLHSRKEKRNIPYEKDKSVIVIEKEVPRPIATKPNEKDNSVIVIEEEVPRPVATKPRCLRPIVIDGSNVARAHGKVGNSYSCKGIQIAINHFLERGHTQVTAFVPHFRRHKKFGHIPTTDQLLLEELAKEQRVVFTPSRRMENKSYTCYDDRFIVDLATKNGGVILSNDNFRDIAAENEEYKKTVQERLLMFCFVGDIIMIPQDPLGRNGPTLENFLSFPN